MTRIPVFEVCPDRDPVARSQARRICARLDSFKEAVLDFEKADFMGQRFADELFMVFAAQHPYK
ncbi:MAG: STAS-like domain-containing protein [Lachnospiraceae bacterium]|nr:STAS-like domain-containing protein [Lachnospiraceae bacterium]